MEVVDQLLELSVTFVEGFQGVEDKLRVHVQQIKGSAHPSPAIADGDLYLAGLEVASEDLHGHADAAPGPGDGESRGESRGLVG